MSIDTTLKNKTLDDLIRVPSTHGGESELTDEKVELVLKCLKFQNGCAEAGIEQEFIGLGDIKIAQKADVSLSQVNEIRAKRDQKIAELTNPEPIEQL